MGTVDVIQQIRDLRVPEGMFTSARTKTRQSRTDDARAHESSRPPVPRTYAAFPSGYTAPPVAYQSHPLSPAAFPPPARSGPQFPEFPPPALIPPNHHGYYSPNQPQREFGPHQDQHISPPAQDRQNGTYRSSPSASYMTGSPSNSPTAQSPHYEIRQHSSPNLIAMSPSASSVAKYGHLESPSSPVSSTFSSESQPEGRIPYSAERDAPLPAPRSKDVTISYCGGRVELAPLNSLQRSHPYRRDPVDDQTLRLLRSRPT